MSMFGVGLPEMAVIAAIGLLVFGPKKLPELGRTLGRTLKGFQAASRQFEQEFSSAMQTEASAPAALPDADGAEAVSVDAESAAAGGPAQDETQG